MAAADRDTPRFHFAAPRLIAHACGRNPQRTQKNWIEANAAGGAVFLVSFAALDRLLLPNATVVKELVCAVPIAILTWLFWLLALYINSLAIKLLRRVGLMRRLSNARAQSILICLTTTLFACWLASAHSWISFLGLVWICAVCVNLAAAGFLTISHAAE